MTARQVSKVPSPAAITSEKKARGVPTVPSALDENVAASRFYKLYHSLGLDSLYLLGHKTSRNCASERAKVVLLEDFRTACYLSFLHLIPVITSLTLVVLNSKGYFIGGELAGISGQDDLKKLGLQFAAKMLELLAMASLSVILFSLIRQQLLTGYLPFGTVTAGFQFSNLSLLWSKEFVATCAGNFTSSSIKFLLVLTILVFTILGSILGPAAATACLPALRDWPAGGTSFFLNSSLGDLFPLELDEVSESEHICAPAQNGSCSPPNHSLIAGELLSHWPRRWPMVEDYNFPQVLPEKTLINGGSVLRNLATRLRGPFVWEPSISVATAPLVVTANAITKIADYWFMSNSNLCARGRNCFRYYNDIFYSLQVPQPVAYVLCRSGPVNTPVRFPRVDRLESEYPSFPLDNNTLGSDEWFATVTSNSTIPRLIWINLPEMTFGKTSIGVIAAIPNNNDTLPNEVLGCTVDARWAAASAIRSFKEGPRLVHGFPNEWFFDGRYKLNSSGEFEWPQVKITPKWTEHLDSMVPDLNISTFMMLSGAVGRADDITKIPFPISAVEGILALMLAEGMSRDRTKATIQGHLKGFDTDAWFLELHSSEHVFGFGGSAFDYTPSESDRAQVTEFKLKITVNGYGYGITPATFLACLVLLIYSFIALAYVAHVVLFSRTTSGSWDSIAEVIALGVNSRPSSVIKNTGAGISLLKTLKSPVSIGVCGDKMEILFEDEGRASVKEGVVERVVKNEFYG